MKRLWILINKLKIKKVMKNKIYLGVMILINISIGALTWLILGRIFLTEISWLLCFMGYPAIFIGLFGGILYLYSHEFS